MPPTEVPRLPPPAPARRESRPLFGQRQSSGELEMEFVWPVRISRTVAPSLALCWMVLSLLNGASLSDSFREAVYVLVISFAILISFLVVGSWGIRQAINLKSVRRERPYPQPRPHKEKIRPLTVNGYPRRKAPLTREEQQEKLLAKIGRGMRDAGERLTSAPPPRHLQGRYAQDVSPVRGRVIEPETSPMDVFYERIHTMYHRCLTRPSFEAAYPGENGQAIYAECKDWWTARNYVDVDGRGAMTWRFKEHEIYKSDRGLELTARRNGFQFPEEGGQ